MVPTSLLTSLGGAMLGSLITAIIGLVTSRFNRANQPDLVANDEAKKWQAEKARLGNDVAQAEATGDLTEVRKDVAP
jgi:hypothetical protein